MINLPHDFNTAQPAGTGAAKLKPGGYVCRIVSAKAEPANVGDKIYLALDVNEGEYKDFFKRAFDAKKQSNPDVKWPCVHGQYTCKSDGSTNRFFKGLIVAIEQSNSGYKFSGEEKTLSNKLVGVLFGEEEFQGTDGRIYTAVKPVLFRSVDAIRKGDFEVPTKRTLTPSASSSDILSSLAASGKLEMVDDDELPF